MPSDSFKDIDLSQLSIPEAARLLREEDLSPVDLTQAGLEKIHDRNSTLNAFWEVYEEEALQAASRAEKELENGEDKGPLHGIPVGIKDSIDIEGRQTTEGAHPDLQPPTPETNAYVIDRLNEARAVIMGKTGLDEWALGVISQNIHMGSVRNPRDPSRVPGGSSGGSAAAVASGMCLGALGTDAGGSVRIPASFCGCVGMKPTFGLVSLQGAAPPGTLFHVGPLTKSVRGSAILLNNIAGYNPEDPTSVRESIHLRNEESGEGGLEDVTLLTIPAFLSDVNPDVRERFNSAIAELEDLGASVVEGSLDYSEEKVNQSHLTILLTDMLIDLKSYIQEHPNLFSEYVRHYLNMGLEYTGVEVAEARVVQMEWRRALEKTLEDNTLLAMPTLPVTAPRFADVQDAENHSQLAGEITTSTAPFNLSGTPAITIPSGDVKGLPTGLQLVGGSGQEQLLFQVGNAYQRKLWD